jgi:hypothetical protein
MLVEFWADNKQLTTQMREVRGHWFDKTQRRSSFSWTFLAIDLTRSESGLPAA